MTDVRDPHGKITTFNAKGAGTGANQGTIGANINPAGAIAGDYLDGSNVWHGFVRAPDGAITPFDVPGAGTGFHQGTLIASEEALSPAGAIVGSYLDGSNVYHGFLRARDGTITTFNVKGAGTGGFQGTLVQNINAPGGIDGYIVDASGVAHGFVGARHGFTTFDAPGAGTASGQGTFVGANNAADAVPGTYIDKNFWYVGYLRIP